MLPKVKHPIYNLTIPSTKKEIQYRPWVGREEKILLMAQEGKDSKEIYNSMCQVVNNCVLSKGFDIYSLTTFDLEYIFIKLRAKSISNISKQSYRDKADNKVYTMEVDLDKIEVRYNEKHSNKIKVNETVLIIMKYPSANVVNKITPGVNTEELATQLVKLCIDKIYDGDQAYEFQEATPEDQDLFIGDLDHKTYEKIKEFFDTMPKINHKLEYTNSKGDQRVIVLSTLEDFFI